MTINTTTPLPYTVQYRIVWFISSFEMDGRTYSRLGFSDLQQREIIQLAEFGAGKYTS